MIRSPDGSYNITVTDGFGNLINMSNVIFTL